MILLALVAVPVLAGLITWIVGDRQQAVGSLVALGGLAVTSFVAIEAALRQPRGDLRWGAGLTLAFDVDPIARGPLVLVPVVAFAVVVYASGYGERHGRARLLGLLTIFVGVMELLLIAADLLGLLMAWELVGLVSWALIAHHWRSEAPDDAAQAFVVTHVGDLGLVVSAGALFATTGSLQFSTLASFVDGGGPAVHLFVGGIVVAAFTKSAQVPFSPWLFSAMSGPTPASALLHSATMVAAGVYLLARLQPGLDPVAWFGPTAIAVGLSTALAGSVVAAMQSEPKKLLAASTSAHYGFMIVAVGAGYPGVGIAHLIAHGFFKALLFITAGVAIDAAGSSRFGDMGLARSHRVTAGLAAIGAAALAGVPPLGGAWTKEAVVAAASHEAVWISVLVVIAGAGSAFYATRFQLLAFGPPPGDCAEPADVRAADHRRRSTPALAILAGATIVLSLMWLPWGERQMRNVTGGEFPGSKPWELMVSLAAIAVGVAAAFLLQRRHRTRESLGPRSTVWADWFGIAAVTKAGIVDPALVFARTAARFDDRVVDAGVRGVGGFATGLSAALARFDDRVVDAGVRSTAGIAVGLSSLVDRVAEFGVDYSVQGLARLTGALGRQSRRIQSGQTHQYYALVAATSAVLIVVLILWS